MPHFCVDSGESLPRRFCDHKILLQKTSLSYNTKPYYTLLLFEYIIQLYFKVIWVRVGQIFSFFFFFFWNVVFEHASLFSSNKPIRYSAFVSCVSRFSYFRVCLIMLPLWLERSVFECVRQENIVEADAVRFINEIVGTVGRNDCCAGVAIKCRNYSWILAMQFSDLKKGGLGSIPTLSMTALTEFFHVDAEKNIFICIWWLYYVQL